MIRQETIRRPARRGFTLTELLVVIAILAVLAGLVAVAVLPTMNTARLKNTRTLLAKLEDAVEQKWKAVLRTVSRNNINGNALGAANGDTERALVMQRAIVLKANFPMTYQEAQASGIPSFTRTLGTRTNASDPSTESAACLLMALKRKITGVDFDVEEVLGAGAIKDTDGDGIDEIVDGWGRPIQFFRWSCYHDDMLREGSEDLLDPEKKLMDGNWNTAANAPGVAWFQSNFYPIRDNNGPRAYYSHPIVVSMGKDGKLGLGAYAQIIDVGQSQDNQYCYQQKSR